MSATDLEKSTETTNSRQKSDALSQKLNWLRAAVLGANDGIVSIAGLIMGAAGAHVSSKTLFIIGMAGLVSGALSMAGGEYVSVSTQKDTEQAAIELKSELLKTDPEGQLVSLRSILQDHGISERCATQVAGELTKKDALAAHARFDLGISPDERTSPWAAAWASFVAFALGAMIPLVLMVLSPIDLRIALTVSGVVIALIITGWTSAVLGGAPRVPAVIRNVGIGLVGMGITYFVGTFFAV